MPFLKGALCLEKLIGYCFRNMCRKARRNTSRSGPVCSHLDTVLDKHSITPQVYHSRSFINNRCNTYLNPEVFHDIISSIVTTTCSWTHNPFIIDKADELKLHFDTLKKLKHLYIKIYLTQTEYHHLSSQTSRQTKIYTWQFFKNKTIPKQHTLESHCLPFIHQYKIGLDVLCEHGGELINSTIAKLKKRTARIR